MWPFKNQKLEERLFELEKQNNMRKVEGVMRKVEGVDACKAREAMRNRISKLESKVKEIEGLTSEIEALKLRRQSYLKHIKKMEKMNDTIVENFKSLNKASKIYLNDFETAKHQYTQIRENLEVVQSNFKKLDKRLNKVDIEIRELKHVAV